MNGADTTHKMIIVFIESYHSQHGYMPSAIEISNAVNVSRNTISYHLNKLVSQEMIETDLVTENDLGECSRIAWMTRGYRFGKRWKNEENN